MRVGERAAVCCVTVYLSREVECYCCSVAWHFFFVYLLVEVGLSAARGPTPPAALLAPSQTTLRG